MAKIKLPSIKANVAAQVKPMNTMVKSITSKLKSNVPKAAKIKGMTGVPRITGASTSKSSGMKLPSFVVKK